MTATNIDTDLFTVLKTVTGVSNRVYPMRFPQGAVFPLLTYTRISSRFEQVITGAVVASEPRFQIDCWSRQYSEARALAAAVKSALLSYAGSGVKLYATGMENESDVYDPDTELYHPQIDVVFLHG